MFGAWFRILIKVLSQAGICTKFHIIAVEVQYIEA